MQQRTRSRKCRIEVTRQGRKRQGKARNDKPGFLLQILEPLFALDHLLVFSLQRLSLPFPDAALRGPSVPCALLHAVHLLAQVRQHVVEDASGHRRAHGVCGQEGQQQELDARNRSQDAIADPWRLEPGGRGLLLRWLRHFVAHPIRQRVLPRISLGLRSGRRGLRLRCGRWRRRFHGRGRPRGAGRSRHHGDAVAPDIQGNVGEVKAELDGARHHAAHRLHLGGQISKLRERQL
mmetsp:Transcript_1743/g.7586  ORF Transcript_1743/g.7586 Transcript_1743/m.7586 type:complete len:235 (-) Transcript_1743:385-1089(-)